MTPLQSDISRISHPAVSLEYSVCVGCFSTLTWLQHQEGLELASDLLERKRNASVPARVPLSDSAQQQGGQQQPKTHHHKENPM